MRGPVYRTLLTEVVFGGGGRTYIPSRGYSSLVSIANVRVWQVRSETQQILQRVDVDGQVTLSSSPTTSYKSSSFMGVTLNGFNYGTHTGVNVFSDGSCSSSSYYPRIGSEVLAVLDEEVPELGLGRKLKSLVRLASEKQNFDDYVGKYAFLTLVTPLVEAPKAKVCIEVQQQCTRDAAIERAKAFLDSIRRKESTLEQGMVPAMMSEHAIYALYETCFGGMPLVYNCSVNDSRLMLRAAKPDFRSLMIELEAWDRETGEVLIPIGENPNALQIVTSLSNIVITSRSHTYDPKKRKEFTVEEVVEYAEAFQSDALCKSTKDIVDKLIKMCKKPVTFHMP